MGSETKHGKYRSKLCFHEGCRKKTSLEKVKKNREGEDCDQDKDEYNKYMVCLWRSRPLNQG